MQIRDENGVHERRRNARTGMNGEKGGNHGKPPNKKARSTAKAERAESVI